MHKDVKRSNCEMGLKYFQSYGYGGPDRLGQDGRAPQDGDGRLRRVQWGNGKLFIIMFLGNVSTV